LTQNPDVIIKGVYTSGWGWSSIDEPEGLVDEIKSRTGAGGIAVKDGRVYAFCNEPLYGMDGVVGLTYWAKLIHPELNLDPEAVYKEYLTKFMGGISYGDAIFVYPEV
jgi:iron complex transport system substrate-binding protein